MYGIQIDFITNATTSVSLYSVWMDGGGVLCISSPFIPTSYLHWGSPSLISHLDCWGLRLSLSLSPVLPTQGSNPMILQILDIRLGM